MANHKYYKSYVSKAIDVEPTTIEIKRKEKVDNGYGGFTELTTILPGQKVRIYILKPQRYNIQIAGQVINNNTLNGEKLLAEGIADIKENDEFTVAGRDYRVIFVREYFDICKQCELEAILNESAN